MEDFKFTRWDEFVNYLTAQNFAYDTQSEKLLEQLRKQSKEDGYIAEADIKALENKVLNAKKNDLETHKEAIVDMIEKEIASRYYYEKGKIKVGLRNDKEIKEAIRLLNDKAAYAEVLTQ